MKLYFRSSSEETTLYFGRTLGTFLVPGIVVLLSGELGMGKTLLARGIGESLGTTRVRSPSFTLVNEYPTDKCALIHADLYRLEPEDVEDLGLEDYLEGPEPCVLLVEWPERWKTQPDSEVLEISIQAAGEASRVFEVFSRGAKADSVFRGLRGLFEGQDEKFECAK
ncbi:MAG: tRNA (adenosine(37)-N6)-threonylcarbamoyltransferase complex ATPase subunit type 1 TsaE [Synergistaceae bacterium]|nr:tRNA (adenosine(37)-N6)-threonylcarbamoyltransferase complex ATPase subunit type 1 TsaE [Synergistaceae bacterium]